MIRATLLHALLYLCAAHWWKGFPTSPGRVVRFQNQIVINSVQSLSSGGKVDQSTNLPSRAVLWKLNCVSCGRDAAWFEARGREGVNPCVARVPIVREETERCKVGFTTLSPFASARCMQRERGREALRCAGLATRTWPSPLPLRTRAAFPGGTARGGLREAPDTPEGSCVCGLRAAVQAKFLNFVALDASPPLPRSLARSILK